LHPLLEPDSRIEAKAMSQETPNLKAPHGDQPDMAGFNTKLALDRTTLAWIRTTLTMASFGFGLVTFFRSLEQRSPSAETARLHLGAIHFGVALIVMGILVTTCAGLSHWFTLRRLRRGEDPVLSQWPLSITVGMLFTVIGLVGLWELLMR
jgi:putative membrane protein